MLFVVQVVSAGHSQMARLVTALGFSNEVQAEYVARLLDTVPAPLAVCYLTNSGSEANDLALRLARCEFRRHFEVFTGFRSKKFRTGNM